MVMRFLLLFIFSVCCGVALAGDEVDVPAQPIKPGPSVQDRRMSLPMIAPLLDMVPREPDSGSRE